MVQPRWLAARNWRDHLASRPLGRQWDQFVAIWASLNLLLVVFDITYVPLRNFWLQRQLHPLPGVGLQIPLTLLPNITPLYDPFKGIEPHRDTEHYLQHWQLLDRQLLSAAVADPQSRVLLNEQLRLTDQMITENPFLGSNKTGTLERIKNRLRQHSGKGEISARQGARRMLSPAWLQTHPWAQERLFWQREVLPLVATNYWRSIDENGRPSEGFWRIDLFAFQSVFLLDIILRLFSLRRRLPGLSWRDALLRRWTDLPLLLPFWRLSRVIPVAARLRSSGLVDAEPVRAVLSRGVVALLAVELIEVIALQLLDGLQSLIRSLERDGRWRPLPAAALASAPQDQAGEAMELLQIWGPLLLGRVIPSLEPQLQQLLAHTLQRSLEVTAFPVALQQLKPLLLMERQLSRQIAAGVVDGLLDLSKGTAEELRRKDRQGSDLLASTVGAFRRELGEAISSEDTLERSQELLCELLEQLKRRYLSGVKSMGVDGLFDELDQLSGDRSAAKP